MGLAGLALVSGMSGCSSEEVYFCPDDGCADRLIEEINASVDTCHVAIAYFTNRDIADALIEAQGRGVEVLVLGEADENRPDNPETEYEDSGINYDIVNQLKKAGIPYRDDSNDGTMHNKYTIVDGRTVLTGSFNYTYAADTNNNENLVVLTSSRIAADFEADFQTLWASGVE